MPAAVVDGNPWRRKARVGKRTDGDAHRPIVTSFGVEDRGSANRTKPEHESRSSIADTNVLRRSAKNVERGGEARECCENAAGPLLAREAVADANTSRLAFDFYTQLSAGTGGGSGRHSAPSSKDRQGCSVRLPLEVFVERLPEQRFVRACLGKEAQAGPELERVDTSKNRDGIATRQRV